MSNVFQSSIRKANSNWFHRIYWLTKRMFRGILNSCVAWYHNAQKITRTWFSSSLSFVLLFFGVLASFSDKVFAWANAALYINRFLFSHPVNRPIIIKQIEFHLSIVIHDINGLKRKKVWFSQSKLERHLMKNKLYFSQKTLVSKLE